MDNIYPGLDGLLPWVDYLVTSKTFPENFLDEQDYMKALPELAHRFGCRVVAATLGKDGVLAWEREGQSGRFLYAPAFDVRAVDTTGAGDIFHAGFSYGLFNKWALPQILEFSCAAAALNCTALGARGGIAAVEEIQKLIKQGARHPAAFPSLFVQG